MICHLSNQSPAHRNEKQKQKDNDDKESQEYNEFGDDGMAVAVAHSLIVCKFVCVIFSLLLRWREAERQRDDLGNVWREINGCDFRLVNLSDSCHLESGWQETRNPV